MTMAAVAARSGLEIITPEWPCPPGVRAAFTLRAGGVSDPPFDTLNLGLHTGDAREAVLENRRRVREALQLPAEPRWLNQVHGAEVLRLGAGEVEAQPPRADAAVTLEPGRICAIQVADCIPVLLAARDGSAVGAAHGGWRGLAGGVLEAIVRALGALRVEPSQMIAWLGPGIGRSHFEVGDEVHAAFDPPAAPVDPAALAPADPGARSAFTRNARGRWQCDLAALARGRLEALGIREIHGGHLCTYADATRFFSYRRDGRCGRMAALIWISGAGKALERQGSAPI
jgi:polyphenol oxidase